MMTEVTYCAPHVQCAFILIVEFALELSYLESFVFAAEKLNTIQMCEMAVLTGLLSDLMSHVLASSSSLNSLISEHISSLSAMNLNGICISDERSLNLMLSLYPKTGQPALAYITSNLDKACLDCPFTCFVISDDDYKRFTGRALVKHILSLSESMKVLELQLEETTNLKSECCLQMRFDESKSHSYKIHRIKNQLSPLKRQICFYKEYLGSNLIDGIIVDSFPELELLSAFRQLHLVKLSSKVTVPVGCMLPFKTEVVCDTDYLDEICPDANRTPIEDVRVVSQFMGSYGLTKKVKKWHYVCHDASPQHSHNNDSPQHSFNDDSPVRRARIADATVDKLIEEGIWD